VGYFILSHPVYRRDCWLLVAELKIHVSPDTKAILDTFNTFQLELRGPVEMKVNIDGGPKKSAPSPFRNINNSYIKSYQTLPMRFDFSLAYLKKHYIILSVGIKCSLRGRICDVYYCAWPAMLWYRPWSVIDVIAPFLHIFFLSRLRNPLLCYPLRVNWAEYWFCFHIFSIKILSLTLSLPTSQL